jgi:NADH-ubiquinone oxidoreductase chain 2
LLSLIIGSIVGLVQHRIKRLLAYSGISHIGFLLLALAINSIESRQSFLIYLMQYSLSNINIFFILIIIGYYLLEINRNNEKLLDKQNSPVQLISQLKSFFYVNPMLAISLAVTIFSSAGIPPMIGFFAKQTVLSAALQEEYYFMVLIAVLTSVIGAVYYLGLVRVMFFKKGDYTNQKSYITYFSSCSSSLTLTISVLTFIILLFIFSPTEFLNMVALLSMNSFVLCAIIPIKSYSNTKTEKAKIIQENKNKAGIYYTFNKIKDQIIEKYIEMSSTVFFFLFIIIAFFFLFPTEFLSMTGILALSMENH